jgi:hypothetical protein
MDLSINWEGIDIVVSHSTENWHKPFEHIELRADLPLPVTETGYRSHFIHPDELALFDGVEDFVRQWLGQYDSPKYREQLDQSKQGELF